MTYKVVPFMANIQNKEGSRAASNQLETVINHHVSEGWEYVRLEHVETFIAGTNGCMGIGARLAHNEIFSMIVFRK